MPIAFKLDYVLEMEDAARRKAAQCAGYAASPKPALLPKLRRTLKQVADVFLTHLSWQAHDGVFMPISFAAEHGHEQTHERVAVESSVNQKRTLRQLTGVKLSATEAAAAWPRILDHKWLLSERLGRDVGFRVAAVDYFENVRPPRPARATRSAWEPLPRLPMMLRFGERA